MHTIGANKAGRVKKSDKAKQRGKSIIGLNRSFY